MRRSPLVASLVVSSLLCTFGALAQNFTADVTVTSTDPDLVLWDTDGKIWYVESDGNAFSIAQSAGNTEVLVIEDSAPEGAFYLDSDGRLGIGTSAPFADLEIFDPNGSGIVSLGLTASTGDSWTISACSSPTCTSNMDGFRVIEGDAPNDPSPLRIRSGALNDSLLIDSNGVRVSGAIVELSSRSQKTSVEAVDPAAVLERVLALPISLWSYRTGEAGIRHLGPMAEDFHRAFGLGVDDRGISTLDTSGVALAAIQGLRAEYHQRVAELTASHQSQMASMRDRLDELESLVAVLVKSDPATMD